MFAAVYLPNFHLQAALRHAPAWRGEPVGVVDSESNQPLIRQANPAALRAGVMPGMTPSQAQARCPNLNIVPRSISQELAATEILLQTAYAFSPNLESTRPGVCILELKGLGLEHPARIETWCNKIIAALESLDLEPNLGVGPTPDLAWLAAQGEPAEAHNSTPIPSSPAEDSSGRQIEFPGMAGGPGRRQRTGGQVAFATEKFVAGLPIAALAPPAATADLLSRWGIHTVGEFLALGQAEVAERLGSAALELFARVSPDSLRPLKLVSPPEQFSEEVEFEHEVETAGPVLAWLGRFLEELTRRLDAIYLVVAQLRLRLGLASGASYERIFKIPAPTGDSQVLRRMLMTHLETLRTDSPIVSLQLTATPARPEMHQFGLFQNSLRNPNQFAETLTRLGALLGTDNVGTPAIESSHRPDAFRLQPPNFEFVPAQVPTASEPEAGPQFRRFRPPLAAQCEFNGRQPARVACKMFTGPVTDRRGPFLSSGHWWDDSRWAREEWDVELAGGQLLRLFRSGDGCFVEGIYD